MDHGAALQFTVQVIAHSKLACYKQTARLLVVAKVMRMKIMSLPLAFVWWRCRRLVWQFRSRLYHASEEVKTGFLVHKLFSASGDWCEQHVVVFDINYQQIWQARR